MQVQRVWRFMIQIGETLDAKFQIEAKLGAGAFGTVYKATHVELNRAVALKILRNDLLTDKETRERFVRESRLLSNMAHPNIVQILSSGVSSEGPYFAMEFLEGKTLASYIAQEEKHSADEILSIFEQICDGMSFAHKNGIIHRDLKPANIMIETKTGKAKILDFGLSKTLDQQQSMETLTMTGALLGTAEYLSPEACMGRRADGRGDIYAVGCMLYEAFSKAHPFDAENSVAILHKHISEPIPRLPSDVESHAPKGVTLVLEKSLQKEPENRFQSFDEMKEALILVRNGMAEKLAELVAKPDSRSNSNVLRFALPVVGGTIALFCGITFFAPKKQLEKEQQNAPIASTPETKRSISSKFRLREIQAELTTLHSDLMQVNAEEGKVVARKLLKEIKAMSRDLKDRSQKFANYNLQVSCYGELSDRPNQIKNLQRCLQLCRSTKTTKYIEEPVILNLLASLMEQAGHKEACKQLTKEAIRRCNEFDTWLQSEHELTSAAGDTNLSGGWQGVLPVAIARLARISLDEGKNELAARLALESAQAQMQSNVANDGAVGSYCLYAEALTRMNKKQEAIKALEDFGKLMPKIENVIATPDRPLKTRAVAANTMTICYNIRDWYRQHDEPELTAKWTKTAKDIAEKYDLQALVKD